MALTGEIMTMPGLPKRPAAERIDVDENGKIPVCSKRYNKRSCAERYGFRFSENYT